MNPETLLHDTAELLYTEAREGPGSIFVVHVGFNFNVTRTPNPADADAIVARYDCEDFSKGLSARQWCGLLRKLWAAHLTDQKGDAGEQQPAKKP